MEKTHTATELWVVARRHRKAIYTRIHLKTVIKKNAFHKTLYSNSPYSHLSLLFNSVFSIAETANTRSPPFLRSRPSEKETFLEETTLSYCQESNDEIRRDDMSLSRNLVDSGCDLGRVEKKPVLRRSSPIISRQHGLVSWIEEIIETSQPSRFFFFFLFFLNHVNLSLITFLLFLLFLK